MARPVGGHEPDDGDRLGHRPSPRRRVVGRRPCPRWRRLEFDAGPLLDRRDPRVRRRRGRPTRDAGIGGPGRTARAPSGRRASAGRAGAIPADANRPFRRADEFHPETASHPASLPVLGPPLVRRIHRVLQLLPIFLTQAYGLGSPEIFGIYIASQVTSIAVYPRVADWVSSRGSRPMQLYGTVGRSLLFGSSFLLGLSALATLPCLALVVALHAGVGACWAVINVASSTLVSRLAPEAGRPRSLAAFNAVQGFGSIFGPLLGGALAGLLGYGPAFAGSVVLVLAGSAVLWATRVADA